MSARELPLKFSGQPQAALSEAEQKRLERLQRTKQNRRGRKFPVAIPAELTRTSAFAPRRFDLIEDRNFSRVYVVHARSIIEVTGRELGSQHRDALYALFRLPSRRIKLEREEEPLGILPGIRSADTIVEAYGTWRDILKIMGLSEHANNMLTVLKNFEELRQVNLRVYTGSHEQYLRETRAGRIPSAGFSDNFLGRIEWSGVRLDSKVTVRYGEWLRQVFEKKHLVSLNSQVYFSLQSDYAKSIWPFIDGQPNHFYIDETVIAELLGRDLEGMNWRERGNFREGCRRAFEDMKVAGGLASYKVEQIGSGRVKLYRYTYVHALPREVEKLAAQAGAAAEQASA